MVCWTRRHGRKRKSEGGFKLAETTKETKTLQKSEASKDENRKHKNDEDRDTEGEEVNINNERVCHVMAMTFTKRDPTSMVRSSLLVYGAIILQRGRKKEDGRSERKRSQIYSCMQEGV